jgi:hypothetical protein
MIVNEDSVVSFLQLTEAETRKKMGEVKASADLQDFMEQTEHEKRMKNLHREAEYHRAKSRFDDSDADYSILLRWRKDFSVYCLESNWARALYVGNKIVSAFPNTRCGMEITERLEQIRLRLSQNKACVLNSGIPSVESMAPVVRANPTISVCFALTGLSTIGLVTAAAGNVIGSSVALGCLFLAAGFFAVMGIIQSVKTI